MILAIPKSAQTSLPLLTVILATLLISIGYTFVVTRSPIQTDHNGFNRTLGHHRSMDLATVESLFNTLNPSTDDVLPEAYLHTPVFNEILARDECEDIISNAESYSTARGGWDTKRHRSYPTVDIDTREILSIRPLVWEITTRRIFPRLEEEFHLPRGHLVLKEAFVVKYTTSGQRMLDAHRDHSELSFVVALNDEYEGGGTHFVHTNRTVKPSQGSMVLFAGKHLHQGMEVINGSRYILAGFVFLASHHRKVESIFEASADGDMLTIQWLIETIDPYLVHAQRDGSLETPLTEAAYHGQLRIAEYLLEHGAFVNQQFQDGFTALYLASQEGMVEIVDLLLRYGANHLLSLHKDSGQTTPLQIASKRGHIEVIRRLLHHDSSSYHVNKLTTSDRSAFWFACCNGNFEVAKLLVASGANFTMDVPNNLKDQACIIGDPWLVPCKNIRDNE